MSYFSNAYQIYLNDHALPLAADPYYYASAIEDATWTRIALHRINGQVNEYARNQNNHNGEQAGWPTVSHELHRITYYTRDPNSRIT